MRATIDLSRLGQDVSRLDRRFTARLRAHRAMMRHVPDLTLLQDTVDLIIAEWTGEEERQSD